MKRLQNRTMLLPVAVLLLALVGALFLATINQERYGSAHRLDEGAPDTTTGVPGALIENLTPRPPVPKELKAAISHTRGRMPGTSDVPDLRKNWFWEQRAYPLDTIPADANMKALEQVEARGMIEVASPEQSWQSLGPDSIDHGLIGLHNCTQVDCDAWRTNVSGRTKVIVFHPQNPNILYVATAVGGIWKSTDRGASYTSITSDQPSHAFHSLALDPSDPNVIYAGTGEIQGYYGVGMLKSTNGGQSWTLLGQDIFEGVVISSIVVHPTQTNTIYAATSIQIQDEGKQFPPRGIFRSTNGGQTWTTLASCDNCYGISDLIMEDSNPSVLYAGVHGQGVLKSTDGGNNWLSLTNGLPDRGFDRVELANGRGGQAGVLYAGLDARVNSGGRVVPWGLIYKSGDHGQSWQLLQNAPNYCSSQCGYDNIIAVHPTNADTVYIGGNLVAGDPWAGVVHKTKDGGQSWQDMTPGTAQNRMVHPDMHAIAFNPANPNEVWVGNDGGIFRSSNGGQTWEHRNSGLSTLQFINIGIHPTNPSIAFGGLQDNAKAKYDGSKWIGLDTGDGGYSEIDTFDPKYWYSTRYSIQGSVVQFQRNDKGGTVPLSDWQQKANGIDINDRVLFYVPFVMDPSSQGMLYLGTHRLYRTNNRGDSWQVISGDLTFGEQSRGRISAIAVAPNDSNTIYTGSSDGLVAVTRNLGGSWSDATGSTFPRRFVSDIAIRNSSADTAYVVFNGYDTHTPSTPGHVFKTGNGGQSWQNISSNLPDIPLLSIVLDPRNPNHLYVGSDIGVFRSTNDGASWSYYNQGLATVPVTDLELNDTTRQLWAGTGGRGVYRMSLGGGAPTPTPTTSPQNRRLWLPTLLRDRAQPRPTPTLPAAGPAPGDWGGEKATFAVTSDQQDVWNIRIRVPVPGCDTWVSHPTFAQINQNKFQIDVDLHENGRWFNQGTFSSKTQANGTATFQDVYFGTSCGSWSGQVNWTAIWQGGAPDPTATPTPTTRPPTATPSGTNGIHGQVRHRNVGIQGITLWLRKCPNSGACDFETSKVASATTDSNGYYQFTGVPTLPANNTYYVYFLNSPNGDNPGDDAYLWRWYGPDITSYSAGGSKPGGDFDIENIVLREPRSDRATLPVTFSWDPRSLPGERYAWELFDLQTGASMCFSNPATSTSFQLSGSDFKNACGGTYGVEYGWFAWIVDGPSWEDNSGFGDSYYYTGITFDSGSQPTATPTPTFTPTTQPPTATPTTAPGLSLSGRVTAYNASAGGVNLQLFLCDAFACDYVDNTTTAGNGSYAFTNLDEPGSGEWYRIRYLNGADGGNSSNANYLHYWITEDITSVSTQAAVTNVNFDIGDVVLSSPSHEYEGYLPIHFQWQGRGVANDRYSWVLSFMNSDWCWVNPPVASTSFTLDLTAATNCDLYTFTPYDWYVYVTDGPTWNNGHGASYYYRTFTITGAQGARERRLPLEGSPNLSMEPRTMPHALIPNMQQ